MYVIITGCDPEREYIERYGEHFNGKLADFAIRHLKNMDGTGHRWSMEDIVEAFRKEKLPLPGRENLHDLHYLANMLYSDWYPEAMATEPVILKAARKYLEDPDGFKGMIFLVWLYKMKKKGIEIPWKEMLD